LAPTVILFPIIRLVFLPYRRRGRGSCSDSWHSRQPSGQDYRDRQAVNWQTIREKICSNWLVKHLKEAIQCIEGIPPAQQQLGYAEVGLEDDRPLELQEGCHVEIVLRLWER